MGAKPAGLGCRFGRLWSVGVVGDIFGVSAVVSDFGAAQKPAVGEDKLLEVFEEQRVSADEG